MPPGGDPVAARDRETERCWCADLGSHGARPPGRDAEIEMFNRSANAITEASTVPKGRSSYFSTSSATLMAA